jgi:hypothetical protein
MQASYNYAWRMSAQLNYYTNHASHAFATPVNMGLTTVTLSAGHVMTTRKHPRSTLLLALIEACVIVAIILAAEGLLNSVTSTHSRRRYMLPARLLAGRVRSAIRPDQGGPRRTDADCDMFIGLLTGGWRTTHLNRTEVDHHRNGLRPSTSSGGCTS